MCDVSSIRPLLAAVVIASASCASAGGGAPTEPAPIFEARDLAACAYERIGEIQEQSRSGMVQQSAAELQRAIGLRARRMGADAVIDFRTMRVGPVPGTAGGRAVTHTRATAVAVRFTSPTCPTTPRDTL